MSDFDVIECLRRLANVVRIGQISSVDLSVAKASVKMGDIVTTKLPWLSLNAGQDVTWRSPSVGEQVLVLSPSGDLSCGVIVLGGIFTSSFAAPSSSGTKHVHKFRDGAEISYDTASGAMVVTGVQTIEVRGSGNTTINVGGTASISVTGNVNLTTPTLALDGDMTCTGTITAQEDVVADGISLVNHKHGGVESGGSLTGVPE